MPACLVTDCISLADVIAGRGVGMGRPFRDGLEQGERKVGEGGRKGRFSAPDLCEAHVVRVL